MRNSRDILFKKGGSGRSHGLGQEAGGRGRREACAIGDALGGFVERLGPAPVEGGTVAEVLPRVLPPGLRNKCRVAAVSDGCVKVVADGSSYLYELRLCKAGLLEELRRLCPEARLRRIEVSMAR